MEILLFIIGITQILYIRCQVTIKVEPASVYLGETVQLTCNYTGGGPESGVKWFRIGDSEGVIYEEQTAPNCSYYSGGSAYNLSRFTTTCDNAGNNYTLSFKVLDSDFETMWCCSYIIGGDNFCEHNASITRATTSTPSVSTPSTTTTTTTTVASSSTSMSSANSSVTIDNTSTKPTTNGSASATISTSSNITIGNISVNPATNESASATNNTPTSTKPTISESTTTNSTTSNKSKSITSDSDIKVIVPAVVVPCGLLLIGGIILVVCCVTRRTGKNVRESPDRMAVQDKGNNIEEWKQSPGHGKATDNLDAVYTTPDGFIIYPGPAAMSTARSYKDKKHHGVTDQNSSPYAGPYHHQAEYFPRTYTSTKAYTHKDKKHHGVTDQYSRPYTGTYGYHAGYFPNTYNSARTYTQKGEMYDYEGPMHQIATSTLAYDQTTYYPQTGHYGQSSQDVYSSGGRQYSYGQSSRSHHDHNGRKQREYYNQYEMRDYGGNRVGYRHTKQDTSFFY